MINFFGFLGTPLAFVMRFIYDLVLNYGWTIIIFTILIRLAMIPLSLMQQKSTARMSAYQPFIKDIQKKWANDKARQNEEMQKFYQEHNINMTAGCLPMLLNMLVLFGIIAVIQAPLQYMVGMPQEQIENSVVIIAHHRSDIEDVSSSDYTIQSLLIGEMKENPQWFIEGVENEAGNLVKVDEEWVEEVQNFNFEFLGMNLAESPTMNFNIYLILPILSILTMLGSQIILMRTGGMAGQTKNTMLIMTISMGVMFGFFAFTVPVGFSLYYTVSNIAMTLQQLVLKQIYDPKKITEQLKKQIEEKKAEKKTKKTVQVTNKEGKVETKQMTDAEIAKLRLEKARQLDEEKYLNNDENADTTEDDKNSKKIEEKEAEVITEKTEENKEPVTSIKEETAKNTEPYKPGRRKRATNKKDEEKGEK